MTFYCGKCSQEKKLSLDDRKLIALTVNKGTFIQCPECLRWCRKDEKGWTYR